MPPRWPLALFGFVLYACPREFRRAYRAAMRADFHDIAAEEYALHGLPGLSAYACSAYCDILFSGLRERFAMIWRDLVYAVRSLRKTPFFTAVVIGTLAVAITANATVFSIVDGIVLRPLPYADPQTLVVLNQSYRGNPHNALSYPNFIDLRAQNRTFADIAALAADNETLTGRGRPVALDGQSVSAAYFDVFSVRPQLGRFFVPADTKPGSGNRLVLSDTLFRTTFGGDPSIVGATVYLNADPYTVVGVAPASFHGPPAFGSEPEYWTALVPDATFERGAQFLSAYGRLRPGTSIERAQADVDAVMANLARRYVDTNKYTGMRIRSLSDSIIGNVRPVLLGVFAAVAGVLLVACANVANLLLSRAATRERELAVRYAIGASRTRIIAQILTETLLFAGCGGALGIVCTAAAVHEFIALRPPGIPRLDAIHFDLAAAGFTFVCVVFCTLAAGIVPALALSRVPLGDALKAAGRGGDRSRGARARSAFVIAEIAVTLAIVVASGLVVRSFATLTAAPLGFDPSGVLSVYVANLPSHSYKTDAQRRAFHRRAVERAASLPGVSDAAWAASAPFSHHVYGVSFTIPGKPLPSGDDRLARFNMVTSGYFGVLRIPMIRGRLFTTGDRAGTTPVVIVNERFAKEFYGTTEVVGKSIRPGITVDGGPERTWTIVGVCADARDTYADAADPHIFFNDAQIANLDDGMLLVRVQPGVDRTALAAIIPDLDRTLATGDVRALSENLATDAAGARLSAIALGTLALIALLLAVAGIYAVVSYGVAQRTHEFGVRKALGARNAHVLRDVLARAARLASLGILIGLLLTAISTHVVEAQLYGIGLIDPLTYGAVIVLLFAAAFCAAFIPALRAMRVDPVVALRYE